MDFGFKIFYGFGLGFGFMFRNGSKSKNPNPHTSTGKYPVHYPPGVTPVCPGASLIFHLLLARSCFTMGRRFPLSVSLVRNAIHPWFSWCKWVVLSVPVHPLVNDTVTTDGRRNNATGNFGPPRTAQNDCSLSTSDLRALSASWLR